MKRIKQNILIMMGLSILLMLLELTQRIAFIGLFGLAFFIIVIAFFISHRRCQQAVFVVGVFLLLWVIFMTRSVWFLIASFVMMLFLFRSNDGNEFFFSGERRVHPFQSDIKYLDVVIRPQSQQRSLMQQQKFEEWVKESGQASYAGDDVNLVFIGGNTIIDLGNSFVSQGQKVVIIRKIYGRTRVVLPRDMGLRLNISAFSGRVIFEQQTYPLRSENFQWVTPQFDEASRRLNLIVSVVFGDIEVIIV